ncbi:MAG: SpoIIE family protein phosphatase [Bacteroidia bacterium]|nr:SpoIIE family protein phosphatase [Bacteroidia bacterium]
MLILYLLLQLILGTILKSSSFPEELTWFLIFGIIFLLLGSFGYFKWVSKRFKDENKKLSEKLSERAYQVMMQKWELERKNLSIGQQNQDILDGLRYARNIQYAVLPKKENIQKIFRDFFVLYEPKDIVSGDFYFYEEVEGIAYLAIADCTGHGVAGAFMSMVGSSLLHQIIGQKKVIEPYEILGLLNEGIVEALQQKENESHSGMDIALLRYDPKNKEARFSGANRPLYLVRNYAGDSLRPDKLPIGGFRPDEDRKFTQTVLTLQEGDRIYLYTDGYADQFGGPQGKKIMSKKFKDTLLSIHESPMQEQKETLASFFDTWKGRYEQVDDVLVVGIKV